MTLPDIRNSLLSLFLALELDNSLIFPHFFQYFELAWPFRQIGRIVNKKLEPAGTTLRWAGADQLQDRMGTQQ